VGRAELLERIRYVVLPVLQELGYDLVEMGLTFSHGRRILGIFIDREGGITLEDCARASKALSAELDRHNLLSGRYYLEVSSPGAERKLRSPEDFVRFEGRKARIIFRDRQGRTFEKVGNLGKFENNEVVLVSDGRDEVRVRFEDVVGANLSL
jgi:ribosome maturation factor RimP